MTLKEVLLHKTKVGDVVIFIDGGWQVGATIIDSEDLFIRSLDSKFLDRKVDEYVYEDIEWCKYKVFVVYIS